MLRFFVLAASLALISPARAENPILAADLLGKHRAYQWYCADETGRMTDDEEAAIFRIVTVLGYDKGLNDLAYERENKYTSLWIIMGKKYSTCVETQAFLRTLAKKAMP